MYIIHVHVFHMLDISHAYEHNFKKNYTLGMYINAKYCRNAFS